jgi:hypothetical protein
MGRSRSEMCVARKCDAPHVNDERLLLITVAGASTGPARAIRFRRWKMGTTLGGEARTAPAQIAELDDASDGGMFYETLGAVFRWLDNHDLARISALGAISPRHGRECPGSVWRLPRQCPSQRRGVAAAARGSNRWTRRRDAPRRANGKLRPLGSTARGSQVLIRGSSSRSR